MDDQSKVEPGAGQPAQPDAGSGPRDLSFLWPVIDRIRAVEIKFEGGASAPEKADMEARLKALEGDIAALGKTLQETLGALTDGVRGAGGGVAEALALPPQTWTRAAAGMATAVALLLIAHSLVVFAYDLPTLVLRLVSIAIPLPIAIWMTLRRRIRPWFEIAMAVAAGLLAVGGMSYVTSLQEKTSFLPEGGREWRETVEYVASIAFAYLTGVLISAALQARSGAPNRAGRATLKLAKAVASVTGKAITTGPQIKKQVDQIQGLINTLMLLASAAMAIATGLRSVLR
jgi:hypothetical protein